MGSQVTGHGDKPRASSMPIILMMLPIGATGTGQLQQLRQ